MADAKKGKWGYRKKDDSSEEITAEIEDGFEADTFDAQKDSKNPDLDVDDDLFERLRKGKKNKGNKGQKGKKGKGKCNEKDFAKGVLNTISDFIGGREEDTISLDELGAIFDRIVGEDFEPKDARAYERGNDFADKMIYDQPGCRKECKMAPWAPECEECCVSYMHEVDWHCGNDPADPENPPATCCTEWTEDCFTKAIDENKGHACADCGYGYSRGYGGYRGGYRGRRRAEEDQRRRAYGYRSGGRYGRSYGGRGYGGYRG